MPTYVRPDGDDDFGALEPHNQRPDHGTGRRGTSSALPSNLSQAGIALMALDAWKHAYCLQYKNQKTEFRLPEAARPAPAGD